MLVSKRVNKNLWNRSWLVFATGLMLIGAASSSEPSSVSDTFMVIDEGTALLDARGEEIERLSSITYAAGALSPDGKWIAFAEATKGESDRVPKANLIVQSRRDPEQRTKVPLIWGMSGSSFQPLWSSDSQRILICEQGWRDKVRACAYRLYDLAKNDVTELQLPIEWWPSDWSIDGKRLLTSLNGRIAWVNIDGTGEPDYLTSELETAHGALLSPDGQRILCMAGFKRSDETRCKLRLSVIDLESKSNKRTIVDQPGETHGYCWSPDGSRIAFTWQPSLDKPADVAVRETFLMTCDPQGNERKTVTSRKYEVPENSSGRDGIVIFFQVFAWR